MLLCSTSGSCCSRVYGVIVKRWEEVFCLDISYHDKGPFNPKRSQNVHINLSLSSCTNSPTKTMKQSPNVWAKVQRLRAALICVSLYILWFQTFVLPNRQLREESTRQLHLPVPIQQQRALVKHEAVERNTPWRRYSTNRINLPYPIFVTSLPKSGTTSIHKFFKCGGQLSSHNWVKKQGDNKSSLAGLCIRDNISNNRPPFKGCGAFDVYSDTGVRAQTFSRVVTLPYTLTILMLETVHRIRS